MKVYLTADLAFARRDPATGEPHPAMLVNIGNIPVVLRWSIRVESPLRLHHWTAAESLVEPGGRWPIHWSFELADAIPDDAEFMLVIWAGRTATQRLTVTAGKLRAGAALNA